MSWFLRRRRKEKRPLAEPAATEVAHPGLFGSPSGPVDLSRSLDAQVSAEALADEIRAFAETATGDDAAFLRAFEARVREGHLCLPPMPEALVRAQQLLADPDCSLAELAREIERDLALATRVVGIANSPFYAGMEPVSAIGDALIRIGIRETQHLLLAISLRSKVFRIAGAENRVQALWQHALGSAVAAQLIAAEAGQDPEPAFLAGLVHDIGRVAILSASDEFVRQERGATRPSEAAVEGLLEAIHAALGARVAASWNLDEEICHGIASHHQPEALGRGSSVARVIYSADALARCATGEHTEDESALAAQLRPLGIESERAGALVAEAAEAFERLYKLV